MLSPIRTRLIVVSAFILFAVIAAVKFGPASNAQKGPAAPSAPIVGATKAISFPAGAGGDVNGDGNADPGDTITYTVTVNNTAAPGAGNDATGVVITDTLQNITTLVGSSVNTGPLAGNDAYNVTGNVSISVPDGVSDLLANDIDPDTGTGAALTMVTTTATSTNCVVATCPANNVTIAANGSFTYNPPPGFEGSDTFTYTVRDNGPDGIGGNGDDVAATGTVTLTVSGMVWFINNGAAACTTQAAGCGRLSNPFSTLAAFQGFNNGGAGSVNPAINDNIFIFESATAYLGGVTLLSGQKLIGQDSNSTLATITGITLPTFSTAFPTMNTGGNATTIQNAGGNGVTLNALTGTNTLNGFTASNSSGFAILGSTFGTVTVGDVIMNTTGAGLSLTTGTVAGTGFTSVTSAGGSNGISLTTITGTLALGSGALSGASGATFNIVGGTVSTTYAGNITQANNAAMVSVSGGHATGTITFNTGTLNATNGTGLQFDNADSTYNFNGTNTMNGGDAGIDILNGSTGTFSFSSNSSISRANTIAGAAFNLSASNANVTYSGSMTLGTTTGNMVAIDNHDAGTMTFQTGTLSKGSSTTQGITITNSNGGTINFNNPTIAITMTGGKAINLATNTGGTMNFTPAAGGNGIDITSTTATTFDATGGGTVIVTGAGNTIASTTGTALNVDNTNIGLSGLNFVSISANGGANGIILNNTGTTAGTNGGLTVTGTGVTDGSGGTIQSTTTRGASITSARDILLKNMNFTNAATTDSGTNCANLSLGGNSNLGCNAPIHLDTVTNATLTNLNITGSVQQGINGRSVTNFVLSDTVMTGIGTAADEDGIHFLNMMGTSSITNTSVTGSFDDNFIMQNLSGTLNLTVSGSTFSNSQQGSGILFGIRGPSGGAAGTGANSTITINSGTQTITNFSGGIVADTFDGSTMSLTVTGSTSSGNNDQLSVSAGDNSNVDLNANNNTLSSLLVGDFVVVSLLGSAFDTGYIFDSRITGNTITVANDRTADGMIANNAGGGAMNTVISGNTFDYQGTQSAITIQGGQDGSGVLNYTVTGNSFAMKLDGTNNATVGILANVSVTGPGDTSALCADIGGSTAALRNTFTHPLGNNMAAGDVRVRQRNDGTVRLPGYAGAATDTAAVVTYLAGRNTLVNSPTATATAASTGFAGGAACTQPSPIPPPADENAANIIYGFDNNLSFLNTSYQSPSEWLAGIQPLTGSKFEVQSSKFEENIETITPNPVFTDVGTRGTVGQWDTDWSASILLAMSAKREESTVKIDTRMENPPSADGDASRMLALQSVEDEPSLTVRLLTRLGEMISPTVYSQEKVPNAPEAGETVCIDGDAVATCAGPGFTLPGGKSVTLTFKALVNNGPYASGINNITNTANVTAAGGINVNTNTTSLVLDAAPDLSVTASDGATTTQPSGVVTYVLTYKNGNAINGQDATGVTLSNTVPANTTFNSASSSAGWSCANNAPAGTVCTNTIGAVTANNTTATKNFAVNVLGALPAGVIQISDTSTIAEVPANTNGTDLNPADNTGNDTTNIIGNWLGTTSTDWNIGTNWSNGVIPPAGNNVSIPAVANLPSVTVADVTLTNMVLNGGNVTIGPGRTITVSGTAALNANKVLGTGTLVLLTGATITRTTGQVECPLRKEFVNGAIAPPETPDSPEAPAALFTFPVGTATGFSPLTANVSATSTGSLTVDAFDGTIAPLPNATTLNRYWQLTETGTLTADLTFTYALDAVDVEPGTEANYRLIRSNGSQALGFQNRAPCPGAGTICVDTGANTIFVAGVESFDSFWTAGAITAPTAAGVSVSGRVMTPDGRGLRNARVVITDSQGVARSVTTSSFGFYQFDDVTVGEAYVIGVVSKQYRFAPRLLQVFDSVTNEDFVGQE